MTPSSDNGPLKPPPLTGSEGRRLYRHPHKPWLQVRQWKQWRWLTLGERLDTVQGLLNLDHPEHPQMPYCVAMLCGLLLMPTPRRMLNLGVGSAAFERFLQRYYPLAELTSVDNDGDLVSLARRYFALPPTQPVIIEDAARFLANDRQHYDLLLCDLHDGEGQTMLLQPEVADLLTARLSATGVLVVNLLGVSKDELLGLLVRVRCSLPHCALLEPPHSANLVLLAARSPIATDNLDRPAQAFRQRTGIDLGMLLERLTPLPTPATMP